MRRLGQDGVYFSSPCGIQSIALPVAWALPSVSASTSLLSNLSRQARKVYIFLGGRGAGGRVVGN